MLRIAWLGLFTVMAYGFTVTFAHARYIRPQLEKTPVARLVENLSKQAKENPKDATVRFNLARVHAMAYALKTDTAEVNKQREGQGAWFGYEPEHVPFQAQATDDPEKVKAAKEHLAQAIAAYKEVLALSPDNLSAQLGYAWCLEQSGDKAAAIKEYRKTIDEAWKQEKDIKDAKLGFHPVTAEATGYLKPLLDATKDKAEIATLDQRLEHLEKIPRLVTPVAIPLRPGLKLSEMEARDARVPFDADGSGLARQWSWITPEAGWLVHDAQGTGRIDSALQLFGSVTFWCFWEHGYEPLRALDNNGDGRLTGGELAGLAIWRDENSNGRSEPGEVRSLAAWGIVSVACECERDATHPDRIVYSPRGVTFADGETRPTYDVVLKRQK